MLAKKTKVSVRDMSVSFGAVNVLKNLSIDVAEGEFLVLLGSSGCGKSTLLNAIAGLQVHQEGQVWIGDKNVTWQEPGARSLSMVFQSYALYPSMTVRGNLSFGLRMNGADRNTIQKAVDKAAAVLQIEHLLDRRPAALSGGQRQRVAIGRALVRNADLFLFDEPLSNLDAKLRAELRVELKKLHQALGATMIYVTHDQVEALTLADRVAIMKDGIILQLSPPEEIYNRPINRYAAEFMGSPPMNFLRGQVVGEGNGIRFNNSDMRFLLDSENGIGPGLTEVDLGIRPEHIYLLDKGSPEALCDVTIQLTELHGAERIAWGRVGENEIAMRLSPEVPVQVGMTYGLGIHLHRVNLYDAASGRRL